MTKEELLKKIEDYEETKNLNRMGCSENWYDPVYAIKRTFTLGEIKKMSEKEINNLIKLANNISEGLW